LPLFWSGSSNTVDRRAVRCKTIPKARMHRRGKQIMIPNCRLGPTTIPSWPARASFRRGNSSATPLLLWRRPVPNREGARL
jgi:hypothetical protein